MQQKDHRRTRVARRPVEDFDAVRFDTSNGREGHSPMDVALRRLHWLILIHGVPPDYSSTDYAFEAIRS
jgi:hypothetical protein